jgi:hypothetical protein
MKAIHGGKSKHDKIDSQKMAALLRGGMLPQACVYPAKRRATRDLLRRRTHLRRKRAELLAHVQNTNSQSNLSDIGKKIAYKANREGVAPGHFCAAGAGEGPRRGPCCLPAEAHSEKGCACQQYGP